MRPATSRGWACRRAAPTTAERLRYLFDVLEGTDLVVSGGAARITFRWGWGAADLAAERVLFALAQVWTLVQDVRRAAGS